LKLYAVHDVASNTYYASQIKELGLLPELLFNGGVYVFNEPRQWATSMLEQIATGQCEAYDGGDQGYLNCYAQRNFMEVGNLPIEYNCILDINQPQVPTAAQRIIHFTGLNANPWNTECPNDWRIPYFKTWDAALKQCNP
jgi:lipopolysaccharide biosynthesis glycosyltransferase